MKYLSNPSSKKVQILGEHFGVIPKYMKTPSFAYQIQTEIETFIIDRESKIKNLEGIEFELETDIVTAEFVEGINNVRLLPLVL